MSLQFRTNRLLNHSAWLQAGILVGVWLAGNAASSALGLPVPGAIVGLGLLLLLLASRRVSAVSMRRGSQWFLADMLLFFVPAVLAVLDHREFLGIVGLKVLFVILVSTVTVMLTTAFAVDRAYRWRQGHARHSLRLR